MERRPVVTIFPWWGALFGLGFSDMGIYLRSLMLNVRFITAAMALWADQNTSALVSSSRSLCLILVDG